VPVVGMTRIPMAGMVGTPGVVVLAALEVLLGRTV
jgi:hypothetical protein